MFQNLKSNAIAVNFARPKGLKRIEPQFTEQKERYEKRHIEPKPSGTYEDLEVGIRTFISHNRKSVNEYKEE